MKMENISFEQKIAESVNQKLTDGTVEKLVNDKLEQGISKALDDLMGYGGDVKKLLVNKLSEVMVPAIENHNFNEYLIKLDTVLTDLVNKTSLADNKVILDNLKTLMNEDVKDFEIVTISQIYKKYQEHISKNIDTSKLEVCTDDGNPRYYDATADMHVEKLTERGWFGKSFEKYIVKFSCDEDKDMNCEFAIEERYGDSSTYEIDNRTIPMDINSLRYLSDFEIYIQKLLRAYSKIKIDTYDSFGDGVEIEAEPEADWN